VSPSEGILLEKMGDGVSGALRIVTELADSVGKLFLIEEPENDLHPDALRALLEFVAGSVPDNQFIVTTHSDLVLRHLGSIEGARVYETSMRTTDLIPSTVIDPVQSRESRLAFSQSLDMIQSCPLVGFSSKSASAIRCSFHTSRLASLGC
jgi:predicted ATPase